MTPVFKSGERTVPSNYRPISILPIASKLAEKVVCDQLVPHLNEGEFTLHPMQFGFGKHHLTEMANCFFVENIKKQIKILRRHSTQLIIMFYFQN